MVARRRKLPGLHEVTAVLARFAPPELAEDWDHVGLLVEPSRARRVDAILLAIDTNERVVEEAHRAGAKLLVSYHPPIFGGLERLIQAHERQRIVVQCIERGLAVYSPHTALDSAELGVNDWLADALGPGHRRPIGVLAGYEESATVGVGRRVELARPVRLERLVRRIKEHLGTPTVQVARAPRHRAEPVRSIAVCAGAGGSVIGGADADLLFTGEMRHHDVLAAVQDGRSVVLCGHTHTERGYLPVLRDRIAAAFPDVAIHVSEEDRAPLDYA
jgi:dinuclear metal center YbgI/SA1388 family protein